MKKKICDLDICSELGLEIQPVSAVKCIADITKLEISLELKVNEWKLKVELPLADKLFLHDNVLVHYVTATLLVIYRDGWFLSGNGNRPIVMDVVYETVLLSFLQCINWFTRKYNKHVPNCLWMYRKCPSAINIYHFIHFPSDDAVPWWAKTFLPFFKIEFSLHSLGQGWQAGEADRRRPCWHSPTSAKGIGIASQLPVITHYHSH